MTDPSTGAQQRPTRRQLKQQAVEAAAADRAAKKERAAELKAMPPAERATAKAADKAAAKQAKAERRVARKGMTRKERRADKREARIFRKVAHRRRRAIGWGIAGALVVAIGVLAAPYVSDITRLFKIDADSSTTAGQQARQHGLEVAEQVSDEGLVLLKNQDGVLPLDEGKVNVFGFASFNLRLGGGGSGGADLEDAPNLYEALEQQGIEYNPGLYQTMMDNGAKVSSGGSTGMWQVVSSFLLPSSEDEKDPKYLTDEVMADAAAFADTALIVVGNDGVEAQDFTPEQLRLTANQRALLDRITEQFDNVVVVVNSGNQMELGFLDEYPQITGALWIGTPGPYGAVSLAKTLAGDVNPSGRLTNTYAYDVSSAPATVNFGDFKYDNAKRSFLNYQEGIYVGYRYYETRYADDEGAYGQAVQFPFGYGLSYTTFDWGLPDTVLRGEDIVIDVLVTNTGDRPGKDVVQVYYSAPYTEGGIEKSAADLAGFAKTGLLAPGESETVNITFPIRDMASWDQNAGGGYILEEGMYQIQVSTDVHSPVGTFDYSVPQTIRYETDEVTGTALTNLFGYAHGDFTYLSRSDWEGTWPDPADRDYTASPELLAAMHPVLEAAEGDTPTYGADNGLTLADMQGLPFDDPQWDLFLDQFTKQEQVDLFSRAGWTTQAIPRLGVPSATLLDGPAGLNSFFAKMKAASYPTAVVVASTWNDQMARDIGDAIGQEAVAYGVQGWYAPGMNIQRTPLGGRNFEYYSEDPLLSGRMGAAMVEGAQAHDILTFMKHFVLNDQEVNARTGVNVFADEQSMRQLYLRPFELTVKEGGANGAMSSFIHIGPIWSGGNPQLLQDLLRTQWGFSGVVSTDAVLGGFMDPALAALNGNDLMLSALGTSTAKGTNEALKKDPVGIGWGLRDRVHQTCYSLLQTDLLD